MLADLAAREILTNFRQLADTIEPPDLIQHLVDVVEVLYLLKEMLIRIEPGHSLRIETCHRAT